MEYLKILFFMTGALMYGQNTFTKATVKSVNVYYNVAEIYQTIKTDVPEGISEIVVNNISNELMEESIQLSPSSNASIISVQYTTDYGKEYNQSNDAVMKIQDSIKEIEDIVDKLDITKATYLKTIELLDKNKATYEISTTEGIKLDVPGLIKLIDYYNTKRIELNDKIFLIDRQKEQYVLTLDKLIKKRKLNPEEQNKKSTGKLIIQLLSSKAETVSVGIKYLTSNASWYPMYDLEIKETNKPINLVYKAVVAQKTGIEWDNVKLTFSSGNPDLYNQAPVLKAWILKYVDSEYLKSLQRAFKDQVMKLNTIQSIIGETNLKNEEYNINTSINENQLNISFDADIPYTIASNGKPYNIRLAENSMPATYKYYAVPKLDSEVYLMAEVSQYSNYYFLRGEANITINGDYVGKTIIDPNQISDVLHLSIGKDKRVNVKREKVKELTSTKLFSSYNESVFTYDISVRNNKNTEIAVQLKDQYPLSSSNDITIDLLEIDHANDNKELGILTWILNLKPNETKKVRVSYKIKYHKDKVLNL